MSAAQLGGGRIAASAAARRLRSYFDTVKQSVWLPVVGKAVGIAFGMAVLAAIGSYSIASGLGVRVPLDGILGQDITGAWSSVQNLAHSEPASTAVAPASLVVPERAGAATAPASAETEHPAATSNAITEDGKVILNLAGENELTRLPGIGPKRAQAILALREKLGGRFKRTTDLLRVKGIGMKFYKRILPHIVLDPPAQPASGLEAQTKL